MLLAAKPDPTDIFKQIFAAVFHDLGLVWHHGGVYLLALLLLFLFVKLLKLFLIRVLQQSGPAGDGSAGMVEVSTDVEDEELIELGPRSRPSGLAERLG